MSPDLLASSPPKRPRTLELLLRSLHRTWCHQLFIIGGSNDIARRRASGGGSSSTTAAAAALRRSLHRQYGLPNANQILLALVVTALLCFALLRPRWLVFPADVAAGLWGIVVPADAVAATQPTNSSVTVSWSAFCDPAKRNFTLPLADGIAQPISSDDAATMCRKHGAALLPEIIRVLLATAIGLASLTLLIALYLQLGRPTRSQICYLGIVPAVALFSAAVLGMVALILWQSFYGPFDNSDCVAVAIAATVIAYLVAVSMVIRWRWPGICAVPNEQPSRQVRRAYRFGPSRSAAASVPSSATTASAAHAPLEGIQVDATDSTAPRTTPFRQMLT